MKPRKRKCKHCQQWYMPFNSLQKSCTNPKCAIAAGRELEAKKRRRQTRLDRERVKTRSQHMKEAQQAFNAYIRERDKDLPCICCGRFSNETGLITGSRWDAGHYRSTGSAPHLRFNEDNCHRQLVYCNRYLSGNAVDYRIGLVNRIGKDRVEILESDQTIKKWSIDEIKEIKRLYRQKTKELQNAEKGS